MTRRALASIRALALLAVASLLAGVSPTASASHSDDITVGTPTQGPLTSSINGGTQGKVTISSGTTYLLTAGQYDNGQPSSCGLGTYLQIDGVRQFTVKKDGTLTIQSTSASSGATLLRHANTTTSGFYFTVQFVAGASTTNTMLQYDYAGCSTEVPYVQVGWSCNGTPLAFADSCTQQAGRYMWNTTSKNIGYLQLAAEAGPDQVTGLAASTTGPTTIGLSWNAATGATGYSIWYKTSSSSSASPMNTSSYTYYGHVDGTSASVAGLSAGTAYYFRVAATTPEGAASSEASNTTAPPTPTGLSATNTSTGVNLTWTISSDSTVTNYQVWRNGSRLVNVSPRATVAWADTNVSGGVDYNYKLSAFSPTGESATTSNVTGHMLLLPANQIAGFAVTNQSGALYLSWTQTSDANATGYQVLRNGTVLVNVTPKSVVAWADTNVSAGVTYNYSMSTWSSDAVGPATTNQSGMLAVASPAHFALTNASTSIVLTWDASLDVNVTSYDVLRNGSVVATVSPRSTATWSETSANVTAAVSYSYTVKARVSANLASSATSALLGHIVSTPSTPGNLLATPMGTFVRLTWDTNGEPNLAGYRIYRSANAGTAIGAGSLLSTTTATTFDDFTGTAGTAYYYRVTSYNTVDDESAPTPDATATFPSNAGGGGGFVASSGGGGAGSSSSPPEGGAGPLGSIAGAVAGQGIHVPKTPFSELKWYQLAGIFLGLLLILVALPFSKMVFPKKVRARLTGLEPVAVVAGAILWAAVYFSA